MIEIEMVEIPDASFAIGKYPITQAQYEAVMGTNPSWFKNNPQNHNQEIAKKLLLKTEIVNDYTTAILKKFNISTQPKFMFFFYQHTGWDIAKDMIDDDDKEQCALWAVQKCLFAPGIWKNM